MSVASTLLWELEVQGAVVSLTNGQVLVDAPAQVLTKARADLLESVKGEVIAILQKRKAPEETDSSRGTSENTVPISPKPRNVVVAPALVRRERARQDEAKGTVCSPETALSFALLPHEERAADRMWRDGAALADLPESEPEPERFDGEVTVEDEWDWFEHVTDTDRSYLLQRHVYDRGCPWCGQRGGSHSDACGELQAEWAMKMPWGKHKGLAVQDLSLGYLRWLKAKSTSLTEELQVEVKRVLAIRNR